MDKKYRILILCAAILFLCFVGTTSAKIWYVDDEGRANFTGIQEAITAANASDTIIVRDGTYTENIDVNKSLSIKSENGAVKCIIRAANQNAPVFEITADYVNISGITTEGAIEYCGILISDVNNCNISNNVVSGNLQGIYIHSSNSNIIKNNNASFNYYDGIHVESSDNNTIMSNSATSNYDCGLSIWNSSSNNVSGNNASFNGFSEIDLFSGWDQSGIYLNSSDKNTITGNSATSNFNCGLSIWNSSSNNVSGNNASSNKYSGIVFSLSSHNTISGNSITHNGACGIITAESCDYNTIADNNASFNGASGIILYLSEYNNITDNSLTNNRFVGNALYSSNNNTIRNNNASFNNILSGIYLTASDNNTIMDNYATSNNDSGICMWNLCSNNTIKNNNLSFNKRHGIFLESSDNNTIKANSANHNYYDGVSMWDSSYNNTIRNNTICSNSNGILLYRSSSNNMITNNALFSNSYGINLMNGTHSNNQITTNNVSFSKYYGILLWDLLHFNNIINNNASNNDLFGILILNSTNQTISNNTANNNERGIGLQDSRDIQLINNTASTNKISGFSLINSTNNTMFNNSACFNTYEGIYLSSSTSNNISTNNVSSNYFGISLYSSDTNRIASNIAESNYYFGVFLHPSKGNNTFIKNTPYIQEDIVYGVRLYVLEILTPSLQIVENTTNASYYIVAENLGNLPDTFKLVISSIDNPEILCLNKYSLSLEAGEISTNTTSTEVQQITVVKTNVETITLNVSDTEPGIYTVKVEIISRQDNTVKDMIETRTIVPGLVDSKLINSPRITTSAIINTSIRSSTIDTSAIINSTIFDSTITDSVITNSDVVSTILNDVTVADAKVVSGNILSGNITINELKYEISTETRIPDLIIGLDYRDSNLVGIKNKTLEINTSNSNTSFNISAEKDYFAGSLSVQKSSIPPQGIPEFTNNVGGYVYANASDNLVNSTDWVIIKVFYDPNELVCFNESSLRLRYFSENADAPEWEDIDISGINLTGNYLWGNISHYSVFALMAQPSVSAPSGPNVALSTRGGGVGVTRPLPEEIAIPIANPGTNIFNFEWLGLDITKVSIDLKSMTINAKVTLKKVDKPAEFPDPPGMVYGYFDISTNIEPEKIRASKIHFKILKSWTVVNDIYAETIKLWRYVNGWQELENAKIKEDDNYLHFYAETKGFSLIAITSEKRALDVTPTAPAPTPTAPTPTPPSESPVPSPPVHPAPVSLTGKLLLIIVAIVASAMIVSVTYWVLRRRKT